MKLRFTRKLHETGDIWSFFFEPLQAITWTAGQSIRLELPRPSWGVDERRFTIASAPFEGYLRFCTRLLTSDFKQSLRRLKPGQVIDAHNIEGGFIWQDDNIPRLMLAAGIGITPIRSILAQALHDGRQLNTTLLYSFGEKPALFADELATWQAQDPSLYVHYLPGGRIGIDKDSSLSTHWQHSRAYVSGPEAMVQELRIKLLHEGMPEAMIMIDKFTGL